MAGKLLRIVCMSKLMFKYLSFFFEAVLKLQHREADAEERGNWSIEKATATNKFAMRQTAKVRKQTNEAQISVVRYAEALSGSF